MMKVVLFACLVALVPLACATQQWAMIDNDYTTIALACSFYAQETGYVAGGTASVQSEILFTTDGGNSFTNEELVGGSNGLAAWLTIDVTSDGSAGVTGGFGFVGIQSGAVMTNNGNWTSIGSELICAYSDAKAIDGQTFALVGIWSDHGDYTGNGVRFSSDGGQTWAETTWVPKGVETTARYGYWLDSNTGYVTGGTFPTDDSTFATKMYQRNEFIRRTTDGYKVDLTPAAEMVEDGYSGLIQKATNGGTQFEMLVNTTGNYYFNEIWCSSSTECWVVASGQNDTLPASWIFYTSDGFNTMETQFYATNMALNSIDFSDPQTGFAGGALLASGAEFYAAFLQTTDGKTWTLQQDDELKNFFCYDISVVNADYAYCAGLSAAGLSSFASWTPNN